jgi:hypothetical protein
MWEAQGKRLRDPPRPHASRQSPDSPDDNTDAGEYDGMDTESDSDVSFSSDSDEEKLSDAPISGQVHVCASIFFCRVISD